MHAYKTSATTSLHVSSTSRSLLANRSKSQAVVRTLVARKPPIKNPDQLFITAINAEIERQVDNADLGIKELMAAVHLSHSQLFRRLKTISGMSPTAYIRNVRLHKANQLLITSNWPISEIAYSLGFTDPNYFSRAYRKRFGHAPKMARSNG